MTGPVNVTLSGMDALTLAADAWGDPTHPPIILSHGGGQTRHSWQGTAQALAAGGWHVLNYDHRGHGDSEWSPNGEYRVDIHAADQAAIARQCSEPPIVVGASLGGLPEPWRRREPAAHADDRGVTECRCADHAGAWARK